MVSVLLRELEQGNAVSASDAIRETYERFGDLAAAFLRGFVVVGLLALSVVGLPWGIRQAVRYQFVAQTTMLDGARRKVALDRSSTLVVGHWFHTAAVIVLLNGLVALFSLVVGMVVLVVFSGLPLWLFSILVSSFSVLVVPYTAIAFVLLYGDRVAEEVDAEPAAQLEKVGV